MGIKVLSKTAICKCPHQGQLNFNPLGGATSNKADLLTITDYKNAQIIGCTNPPISGGPCLTVLFAQDPIGVPMSIKKKQVVTESVISLTDKGLPITIMDPGNHFAVIKPSVEALKKSKFLSTEKKDPKEKKDVISSWWGSDRIKRGENVKLLGRTKGFGNGTTGTLNIYEYDKNDNHKKIRTLFGKVKDVSGKEKIGKIETNWKHDKKKYSNKDNSVSGKIDGNLYKEYFFELIISGKKAKSDLLEEDFINFILFDEEGNKLGDNKFKIFTEDEKLHSKGTTAKDGFAEEFVDDDSYYIVFDEIKKKQRS
nr:hypothetical protein 3 [Candidatus Aminicenantes bacterium]